MTILEKQPSEDLISMIKVAGDSLLSFGELWGSIKKKGASEGFSETDLQEMLRPYLKQKMDSKKIWYLFHKEEHNQKSAENYQKRTINRTNVVKKEPEQSQEQALAEEEEFKKWEQNKKELEQKPEEPTKEELEEIKSLQTFKDNLPAGPTIIQTPQDYEKEVFEWLSKRDDKMKCFWYDAYGIDGFKNRELAQLKNSGVKTFKRLYFEV